MEIQINYHNTTKFQQLKTILYEILEWTLNELKLPVSTLEVIITDDIYLKKLHKEFFNLNSNTDVITFNLNDSPEEIEGEIYISVDRAIDHANQYNITSQLEICRLLVHGCLHLAGYDDKEDSDIVLMKSKEDKFVERINHIFHNKLNVHVS